MTADERAPVTVREAAEEDAERIGEIFRATYGESYPYHDFYDIKGLKRMIFGDDTLMIVAEDEASGEVLGTASVILDIGAYTDLLGEFGRLAVHPGARGRGIGARLMEGRLKRVRERLHVGITEARVVHPFSQKIAAGHGFAPVGFLPMKVRMAEQREHVCLMAQYFGDALELRRNNPRIVPEVYRLATVALDHVGLPGDVVVDEESAPYPSGGEYGIREMTTDGYSDLLRIERGRVRKREVFGPLQLHYGMFKLQARHSNYLLACADGAVAGAVGFTLDPWERDVRVFELISMEDEAVRFLLRELLRRCREELDVAMIEIDVGADAPRMQRTLLEMGFVPAAYVPAMAFQRVERRDVVKFVKLLGPLEVGDVALVPAARPIADLVLESFEERAIEPRISEVLDRVDLFDGLNEEQVRRVASMSGYRKYETGEPIFGSGEPGDDMFLILTGEVAIRMPDGDEPVGRVGPGECLGEVALLMRREHYCTAVATRPVEAGVMTRDGVRELVRLRPDIGVVLYRNLAMGLGDKLHRTDRTLAARPIVE